jgi:hypothetical protein
MNRSTLKASAEPCILVRTVLVGLVGLALASAALAEKTEVFRFEGRSLFLGNLIGEIHVEGHDGDAFEVEVTIGGRDADRLAPELIARQGSRASLEIAFPVAQERRFVYPPLGRGRTTIAGRRRDGDGGWLRELLDAVKGERIEISGRGSGSEVWADVTVRVPRGRAFELEHGVGEVSASGVDGELSLDLMSGAVAAERVRGSLQISTGSGSVDLADIDGELSVDTGSGAVTVTRADSPRLAIDTGSGPVDLTDVRSRELLVDTGSGPVTARGVSADGATIDTGSGEVVVAFAEMGSGAFEIDTGSGSITLLVPSYASAQVQADTGSGGIQVDLRDYETLHRGRDELTFRLGGGDADVRLDTGSGSIRVAASN